MNQNDGTADAAIDEAVAHWRAGVRHLEGNELDELADHLAISARTLLASGLAPDEAVCVAARRLGAERDLVREYERGDGRTRNADPLVLFGASGALVLMPLVKVPVSLAAVAGQFLGIDRSEWASATIAFSLIAPFLLLYLLMRGRGAARGLHRVARSPWITLAAALVLLTLPLVIGVAFSATLARAYGEAISYDWTTLLLYGTPSWLVPLGLLALALRRTRAVEA